MVSSNKGPGLNKQGVRNLAGALKPAPKVEFDPAFGERRPGETFDDRPLLDALDEARKKKPFMRYFRFGHLKPESRAVSRRFAELALVIFNGPATDEAERQVALRKLLESKDAAVRAALPED